MSEPFYYSPYSVWLLPITPEQAETLWRDADVMWLGLVSGMHHKVVRPLDLDLSSYLYLRVRSDG